jgi:hypothetical protein
MKTSDLKLGKKVLTPYGPGTIVKIGRYAESITVQHDNCYVSDNGSHHQGIYFSADLREPINHATDKS